MTNRTTPVGTVDEELVGSADLIRRLQRRVAVPGRPYKSDATQPINPDGPEAATRIEQLLNRVERLTGWVEDAYLEGYSQGMTAGGLVNREEDWAKSKARAALTGEHQLPRDSDR